MDAQHPAPTGRHILYSIWQRVVGSQEAFYTCSDVDFGGSNTPTPTPTPTPTDTPTPTPTPTPTETPTPTPTPTETEQPSGSWQAGTSYAVGDRVTYNGASYECRQAHTAIVAGNRRTPPRSGARSEPGTMRRNVSTYGALALLAVCGLLLIVQCGALRRSSSGGPAPAARGGSGFNATDVMFCR